MATYVFDLDGTICENGPREHRDIARRRTDVVAVMHELKDRGNVIRIFTARGMDEFDGDAVRAEKRWREETEDWLFNNEVPYDELIFGKPAGDIYIDDKGMNVDAFMKNSYEYFD